MTPSPPRLPAWLLERLLAAPFLEPALGDLAEEYVVRAQAHSPRAARHWYWMQIVRSLPAVFRYALKSAGVVRTVIVAVLALFGANAAESLAYVGVNFVPLSDAVRYALYVIVGVAAIACGGYVAARIRPPAALLMAAISLATVVVLMLDSGSAAPLWYQLVFLVAGPLAPIAGGALGSLHHRKRIR